MTTYAYGGDPTGLSGKYHYGSGALGIRGDAIPSTGTSGPGYIYNSLSLPADNAKEYYGVLGTIPAGLTLDAGEDSGVTGSAPDGTYVVPFTLYEFGVSLGASTFTMTFGTSKSLTGAGATFGLVGGTGAISVTPPVAGTVNLAGSDSLLGMTAGTGAISVTPAPDPRYARPTSTVSTGAWLPSSGASLPDMIDEPSADSTDYIYTTSASTCEIALNPVADPGTSSGQVVRYQAWSPDGNGLTVRLKQGATIIAVWTHSSLPTSPTIFAQTLSPSECDSITDYTNLRFEFVGL